MPGRGAEFPLENGIDLNIDIATIVHRMCNLGVLLVVAGICSTTNAQDNPEAILPDVRLVIDISGSMKQNDPDNLRQPAVELLLQLLPGESRAGIWTFGRQVNMLVPHKPVTEEWRREAARQSTGIQSVGLYTNIGEALEKAAYDLNRPDPRYRTSIILLTDGMVDIDRNSEVNEAERQRIIEHVLPTITRAGYRIHTIALSDNADRNLMDELSAATDGIAATAHSADDLMRIFLRAFDAAAPSEQVPLRNNRFVIDPSVNEFTALIFREAGDEPTTLMGPDETIYLSDAVGDSIKWYSADNYDLITVKQPLVGEWQVGGPQNRPDSESRVTVISNLNLRVEPMPHNLSVDDGSELVFQLEEDGKTITRTDFLSLLSINAELELVEGEKRYSVWKQNPLHDSSPVEGIYRVSLPKFEKPGLHAFTLLIDGKSFTRKYAHDFFIRPQFKDVSVAEIEDSPVATEVLAPAREEMEVSRIAPSDPPQNVIVTDAETATSETATSAMPVGLVYAVIAVVNLMVFAGAFFAYRYIMGDGKKTARGESGEQHAGDTDKPPGQQDGEAEVLAEPSTSTEKHQADEDEDEEPPMDDLDSAINELSQLPEFAGKNSASSEEKPETIPGAELDDLDLMSIGQKTDPGDNDNTDKKNNK